MIAMLHAWFLCSAPYIEAKGHNDRYTSSGMNVDDLSSMLKCRHPQKRRTLPELKETMHPTKKSQWNHEKKPSFQAFNPQRPTNKNPIQPPSLNNERSPQRSEPSGAPSLWKSLRIGCQIFGQFFIGELGTIFLKKETSMHPGFRTHTRDACRVIPN